MAINAEQLNIIIAARDREFAKAMDNNARRVERFAKKSKKELKGASAAFAKFGKLASAATIGASIAITARTIDNATKMAVEITQLSTVAGVTTTKFQELAFASKKFGVDQNKLSDILKDVNDKLGDYATTGAGPLADFFENIAPKVDITADAFKGLSSSDALQLYVKSLEDANVSQAEMTFFMEAIASDATLLEPLFRNNATALNEMSASAHDLGAVLDEDLIKKSVILRDKWDDVITAMKSKLQKFALEAFVLFGRIFNVTEEEQFIDVNDRLKDSLVDLWAATAKLNELNKKNTGRQYTIGIQMEERKVAGLTKEVKNLQETLNVLDKFFDDREASQAALESSMANSANSSANAKQIAELEKVVKAYEALAASYDPIIAAANEYAKSQETINAALAANVITQNEANVTLGIAKQKFEEATGAAIDLSSVFTTMESSMTNAFMTMVDGTMTAKDAFRSMASDIIKELYRVLVVQQLVGSVATSTKAGTGIAGFIGGLFSGGGNAAGGTVQAGVPTITGESGRELFVPQSNGRIMTAAQTKQMQGGGGSVVVNQTINVTTGVQQTVRAEIKSLMPQIADSAKAAVLDAKRRGGSFGGGFA
tara:strand:- start:2318 stop:4117 length:1800 start_codon:yes stop_codon:yes gene_type:complete